MPVSSNDPYNRASLEQALSTAEALVAEFFSSLTPAETSLRLGDAWTPAEHVAHLNTSVSAVARGFAISRWILRLRFGAHRGSSRTFAALRDDYRALLDNGGGARGAYVPRREDLIESESTARRTELLARWQRVNERLRLALQTWTEHDLDRIQLPHPLLGKITAREMVFFTIYHAEHHVVAAKRRLPRLSSNLCRAMSHNWPRLVPSSVMNARRTFRWSLAGFVTCATGRCADATFSVCGALFCDSSASL